MEKSADELLATPWWRATDADLLAALREAEELHRRAYAATLAILAETRSRGLTGGYPNARLAVHDAARIPVTEAARREAHIDLLDHSRDIRAAVEQGLLGPDHLDVIGRTLATIPGHVDIEQRAEAEALLVEHGRTLDARALKRAARHLLSWLDQDGPEPAGDVAEPPANTLYIDTQHTGHVRIAGRLAPEAGALLIGLLGPLAKPRPVDGHPDHRGSAERHGDALAELLHRAADTAATPIDGGERPHLTLTMSLTDLREQTGRPPRHRRPLRRHRLAGPPPGLRRQGHPARARLRLAAAGRRPRQAHRPTRHPPRPGLARRRLRLPHLRPPR